MHERSLVQALLGQVSELARREHARAVRKIRIRIGTFAGVETELFRAALNEVATESLFVDTEYSITEAPLTALCHACGTRFEIPDSHFHCAVCRSSDVTILEGDAVILEDVELTMTYPDPRSP